MLISLQLLELILELTQITEQGGASSAGHNAGGEMGMKWLGV
jgi:hypothetical protein